jgi:DNA mismatch endonuclease (patch repair protein)
MADHMTPEQRSRAMSHVKLRDGPLERYIQRGLHKRGLHFRKHVKSLPGSPDIVFPKEKVAVFVDGDFWHGWRLPAWEHKLSPFWKEKLRANRKRDRRNFRRLRALGWRVVRIWQHQINQNPEACIRAIVAVLSRPGPDEAR